MPTSAKYVPYDNRSYVDQMSSWAATLADWKYFCVFEFGSVRTSKRASELFEQFLRSQKSAFQCYYTIEEKYGLRHVHALLTAGELSTRWHYGSFSITPYDPSKPGIYYINKFLGHNSEWHLFGF